MKKTIGMLCMLLVTLGFVSGCQGRQEASSSDKTITVRDAKGEVAIPAEPKRIVDLSGNSDILSLLGYPVAGTANSDAYDYTQLPTYLQVRKFLATVCRIPWTSRVSWNSIRI